MTAKTAKDRGEEIHASNKRSSRITDARLAVKQGQRWVETHPGASASQTIRDMKLALQGMLDEVDGK